MTQEIVDEFRNSLDSMQLCVERGQQIREQLCAQEVEDKAGMIDSLQELSSHLGGLVAAYRQNRETLLVPVEKHGALSKSEVDSIIQVLPTSVMTYLMPTSGEPESTPGALIGDFLDQIEGFVIERYHLRELEIDQKKFGGEIDLRFLEKLQFLRKVVLKQFKDQGFFPDLTNLSHLADLELHQCSAALIPLVDKVSSPERVVIFGSRVSDGMLGMLGDKPSLTSLELPCSEVKRIASLAAGTPPPLRRLNLSGNPLHSLEGIQNMSTLEKVLIRKVLSKDLDFTPLLGLPALKEVTLDIPEGRWSERAKRSVIDQLRSKGVLVSA